MKSVLFATFIALCSFAHADSPEVTMPPMGFIQWEQSFSFKLPYDVATKDGLLKLMEATTEEYYATFIDGSECHGGARLGGVIKKNNGMITGEITLLMEGYCVSPKETEEQAIQRAKGYTQEALKDVPGIVVAW